MHVLDAYRLWFDEVYARGATPDWYPLGQHYTLAEAGREMRAIDRRVQLVLGSLRPADLDADRRPREGAPAVAWRFGSR
jgi:hypothetical protein